MIRKTLTSPKGKLFNELGKLVWEGKELTFIGGIGAVNNDDNNYFINYIEYISSNNYIKDINDYSYYMMNKMIDRMTIKEIKEELHKVKKKVEVYRKMSETTRIQLAISQRLNDIDKFIRQYESKMYSDSQYRYIYMESINKLKSEKDRL